MSHGFNFGLFNQNGMTNGINQLYNGGGVNGILSPLVGASLTYNVAGNPDPDATWAGPFGEVYLPTGFLAPAPDTVGVFGGEAWTGAAAGWGLGSTVGGGTSSYVPIVTGQSGN